MRSILLQKMSEEQFSRFSTYVFDRLNRLRSERSGSDWFSRRELFERRSKKDYGDRKDSIFARSNKHFPIVDSVASYLVARMTKDLFGSSPWFVGRPEGPVDGTLASQVEKHLDWKIRQSRYTERFRLGLRRCMDMGEIIVKTTWEERVDARLVDDAALYDTAAGAYVVDPAGESIWQTDETLVREDDGAMVFAKAPEVVFSETHEFRPKVREQVDRLSVGLVHDLVDWRDVLVPMNVSRMEDADFVGHCYETRWSALRSQFNGDGKDKDTGAILELLRANSTMHEKKEGDPKAVQVDVVNDQNPVVKVVEAWLRFDAFDDGIDRNIVVVVEEGSQSIIDARFASEVSPRAKCPIHIIPIFQTVDSVFGRGMFEIYEEMLDQVDTHLNSILWRNSYNADPVKIWNPSNLQEGVSNKVLEFRPGKTYTAARSGIRKEDILELIEIPDMDDRTFSLWQVYMQMIQTDSGVTSAVQGEMSSLPNNSTATGINSMMETASVLHLSILDELREGIERHLGYCADVTYFRQDADETFDYLEGEADQVLALSDARVLSRFPMNVRLMITRTRRLELRQSAVAAIPLQQQYLTLPPLFQRASRDLYLQAFKGLDLDNADQFLPSPEDWAKMQAEEAAKQAAMQAQAAPPVVDGAPAGPESVPANVVADEGDAGMMPPQTQPGADTVAY